jgi:hypothetical protein
MKVCIVYTGLNRFSEGTKKVYEEFLTDPSNQYSVIFCTWSYEDTTSFEEYFVNSKVYKFDDLDTDFINNWIGNTHIEYSGGKTHNHVRQWYIRWKVVEILEKSSTNYDLIILTRTDVKLWKNITKYYENLKSKQNCLITGIGPTWDVDGFDLYYGVGAAPTVLWISDVNTTKKVLEIFNNKDNALVRGRIHDESSFTKWINYLGVERIICPFDCFVIRGGKSSEEISQNYILQSDSEDW